MEIIKRCTAYKRVLITTSDNDRKQIISAHENGFNPSVIAHMLSLKKATVNGIIKRYKETWQIEAKKRGRNHAKLLTTEAVDSIREWITENNNITLNTLVEKVFAKYGVRVGISTIAKEVKGLNRLLKKTERESRMVQAIWQICHFCLSQDEETLAPITNILDSYLTIENIERFTGVSIKFNDRSMYAVCPDCTNTLQNSVLFRFSCIRNDAYLREHFPLDKPTPASSNLDARDEHDPLEMDNDYTVFEICEPLASGHDSDSQETLKTTNSFEQVVKEKYKPTNFTQPSTTQNIDSQPRLTVSNRLKLLKVKEEFDPANFIDSNTKQNSGCKAPLNVRNDTFELLEVEEEYDSANCPEPITVQDSDSPSTLHQPTIPELVNVEDSANYIERAETTCSDSDEHEPDDGENASHGSNRGTIRGTNNKIRVYKNGVNLFNIPRQEQKMLCNICGKFITHLVNHMAIHTQETKYACPHCPARMTHLANLTRHIQAVHLKVIRKSCELCGKGFTSKNSLLSHMRSNHGIGKLHECKICSKKYSYPSGLREHYNRTHDAQYHKCATCDKGFTTRPALRNHQAVHFSHKPFACSECPKSFKSSNARKTHYAAIHSGILFKCTICDKSYRYKSLLNAHLRKMHASNDDGSE
ncbi:zinc finger protein 54-like [Anopheles moucheti]|uniref:zinc finger protein 54-like n=1 Tax=Anopheles moucheti TaxID=186751 RepID=UPI0022F0D3C1|nr:zinc finger protein 54-like [Anopheles moucheti]XP_052889202.1 zinc finger protein 54-like [Anopheles moucheti]